MLRSTLCLLALLWAMPVAPADHSDLAKQPIHVSLCQLAKHPEAYHRKLVELSGEVLFGKFNFDIDADCGANTGIRIWLDLGGDVLSPHAEWGVGPVLPKEKGKDPEVEGVTVPLVHDALLDQFVNDVGAMRFRKPDGEGCGSECLFYDVTATLRGRFFSGRFGMEDCCNLLVIEKVVSVSSKRTGVPARGEFQCKSDRWQLTPEELKAFAKIPGCSSGLDFSKCYASFAKHWGDTINPSGGWDSGRPWTSPDMTLSYQFHGGFVSKPHQPAEMTPNSFVTRTVCRATSPPRPAADRVYCNFYRSFEFEDTNAAMALQKAVNAGIETWRTSDMAMVGWLAYGNAITKWRIASPGPLKLAKCEAYPSGPGGDGNQQQWGYCVWYSPDDLRELTIEMHKPGYLTKAVGQIQKVPWIAEQVQFNLCHTAPESH